MCDSPCSQCQYPGLKLLTDLVHLAPRLGLVETDISWLTALSASRLVSLGIELQHFMLL